MSDWRVNSLFRDINSRSWDGNISQREMGRFLDRAAGEDGDKTSFTKNELSSFLRRADLDWVDSNRIFNYLKGDGGKVAVSDVKDFLNTFDKDGKEGWSRNEFKRAVRGLDDLKAFNFDGRRGNNNRVDRGELAAMIKEAAPEMSKADRDAIIDELMPDGKSLDRDKFRDIFGPKTLSRQEMGDKLRDILEDTKKVGWDDRKLFLNQNDFAEIAKKAGITDEGQIDELYDIIGNGNRISKREWQDAVGDLKMKPSDLKAKLEKIYDDAQGDSLPGIENYINGNGFLTPGGLKRAASDFGFPDVSWRDAKMGIQDITGDNSWFLPEADFKDLVGSTTGLENLLGDLFG